MIKEIKYTGYSANPSDYDCADGDLAVSLGLINEDGALKPILPPAEVMSLSSGEVVKYIHKTSSICHYIIQKEAVVYVDMDVTVTKLYWRDLEDDTQTLLHSFTSTTTEVYGINAIGNTLVVLASDGMHYFLWKGDDGYLYLGTDMPECPLSFGLRGELKMDDEFEVTFAESISSPYTSDFSDDNKSTITEQVLAKVNLFISENATNAGKFIYPFFVRYAYRLYDGTLTKHSAPILMLASTDEAPYVFWNQDSDDADDNRGTYSSATMQIVGMLHQLDYAIIDEDQLTALKNWEDIVSSVDVFISAPIYSYDQSGECEKFINSNYSTGVDCFHVCRPYAYYSVGHSTSTLNAVSDNYFKFQLSDLYDLLSEEGVSLTYRDICVELPAKTESTINEDIQDCSQFYFLKSINLDSLETERTVIEIDDDYLDSLVAREVMTDDYDSHDKLTPMHSFVYNSRLNIANISKMLFEGHHPHSLFNFIDGYLEESSTTSTRVDSVDDSSVTVQVYIYINQDGNEVVVASDSGAFGYDPSLLYIYYPNIYAYKAVLKMTNGSTATLYEVQLANHDFLNGAVYFGGWDNITTTTTTTPTSSSLSERVVEVRNKIYSSDVDNPYYFPVTGINTVGTGDIVGVSSAAKALSQGQFGSFPLYVFTTEGIWALEVSDTGTYSAKQTITRDVCINSDSITQIDSAVLFATDRGIMLISGSETQCISDTLNYEEVFTLADLQNSSKLVEVYNDRASENEQIAISDIAFQSFKEFLSTCQMVYDYVHQRIVVYNPNESYAYVYSMKSKMWGMMQSNISSGVNSYPDALAMTSDNTLVNFSESDESGATGLLVTRPFKIDDPNIFKAINTVIQRGHFDKNHVSQVLYGSNDLYNWVQIWSSKDKYMRGFSGSPYKAFRLVVFCDFGKGESLSGFTVQFAPRMTNRLR